MAQAGLRKRKEIEASHVILLQGDEPLLLPSYIDSVIDAIANEPTGRMERYRPN